MISVLTAACEGTGSAGGGLVVEDAVIDPACTPVPGTFPSGLTLIPGDADRAAVVISNPPGVATLSLGGSRPRVASRSGLPEDSDFDGERDADASRAIYGFPLVPVMGEVRPAPPGLLLVSTSNYEQVLLVDAASGALAAISVETPADFEPRHRPLLPAPGAIALRTGISTLACIFPPEPWDSAGDAIPPDPRCDPARPSFQTRLTAGKTVVAGHLFVATSNLRNSGLASFFPGTLLVFEWDDTGASPRVRPSPVAPVLFTSGANPTGVTHFTTPGGRELVLVTVSGAIGTGTGAANARSEAFLDVIDPVALRRVASIPLGLAGPSFDAPAVDPAGRIALLGASSQRQLYAVDLRPLDDPALYRTDRDPVLLDGLTAGFPDARIASAAAPILLPDRTGGPPVFQCEGLTSVVFNAAGDLAFATDQCDGTLTRLRVDTAGDPPVPLPAARIQPLVQNQPFAPRHELGLLRSPGTLRVRPGVPGIDYAGPDLLLTVGEPDAQVCGLAVEALPGFSP